MRSRESRLAVLALAALLCGCGAGRKIADEPSLPASPPAPTEEAAGPRPVPRESVSVDPAMPDEATGVIHVVRAGETLWSISRTYGQTVESVAEANDLADVNRIETGQGLLIPGATRVLTVPPVPLQLPGADSLALAWPVPEGEILSRFGARRRTHRHTGLDIRGRHGDPVTAAAGGTVTFSSSMRGYGKTVIIDHGDGLETLYAHNKDLLVRVGETVSRGQTIARVGRTGNATTAHCHFEVRRNGIAIDPLTHLSR